MRQQEPHIPEGGHPPAAGRAKPPPAHAPSLWESLILNASTTRRDGPFAATNARGLVQNGRTPADEPRPALPAALLLNQKCDLPLFRPTALAPEDDALDDEQREAVARAVQTPDICLIQGVPGSGKSRVVVEIVRQAVAQGERVLLLAPAAPAIDRVLAPLAQRPALFAIRLIAADEAPENLETRVRQMTLPERARCFREEMEPKSRAVADDARRRVEALQACGTRWERLREIAERRAALDDQHAALDAGLIAVAAEVEAAVRASRDSPGLIGDALGQAALARDAAWAEVDAQAAALRAEQEKVRAGLDAAIAEETQLRSVAKAGRSLRFWSRAWWAGCTARKIREQLAENEATRQHLNAEASRLTRESDVLTTNREAALARYLAQRQWIIDREVERKRGPLENERAALLGERQRLSVEWEALRAELPPEVAPTACEPAVVRDSAAAWKCELDAAEARAAVSAQWALAAHDALADLSPQLLAWADVVAAPTSALLRDAAFDKVKPFDLLIYEEADRVTESEFLTAARRARRWVLVGEPSLVGESPSTAKSVRPAVLRAGFFHRLWDKLHADARRLPFAWFHRDGRLVCRLRGVEPTEERWVETERVADRPEVELRIVTPPRGTPRLAEVVFPVGISVADAKAFVVAEIDEIAIQVDGRQLTWTEEQERVCLWFDRATARETSAIALSHGLAEWFDVPAADCRTAEAPCATRALIFERSAGWTRDRAEAWVADRFGLRDLGRTALLATPRRMRPALARFLAGLLAGHAPRAGESNGAHAPDSDPAAEFIAVPPLPTGLEATCRADAAARGRGGSAAAVVPRPRAAHGGAGLETELSDVRRPDALPAELRAFLPAKGLVNFLEAQAVVRFLEALAADRDFTAAARRWSECEAKEQTRDPAVAVIALYPAQAELIRRLIQRSGALAATPATIEIGTPESFRQRECLVALVGLTRSHAQRAVSFGDGPQSLALALTRARERLVLFGDFGTLVRRVQCHDPVDHLDAALAARERAVAAQLVGYIQGRDAQIPVVPNRPSNEP